MRDVYLDYAATCGVRPAEVVDAVCDYLRDVGATPGRSGHRRAVEAGRIALRCRTALAGLLGAPGDPGRVVFQLNATHALNTALHGLLRPGDRVVRTAYDHNAIRRPVAALAAHGVRSSVIPGAPDGSVDLALAERLLEGAGDPARVLVLPHASNALGTVLPVAELAERAHRVGARVVLDAAQTVGHLPVEVERLGADVVCFAGHKGLLGPGGIGGLWIREGVEVRPSVAGGTGADSHAEAMPELLPDRLEAGSQNGPGIAGLLAGVRWVQRRTPKAIHAREAALKARVREQLAALPGVRVLSPAAPEGVPIVLVDVVAVPAAEVAHRLDRDFGVLVRAGVHCAPESHRLLGTDGGGAVRFSLGWATTEEDVDLATDAVAAIVAGARTNLPKRRMAG